ncbi:hypothetical protein PV325_006151 [Microctonus aethiopoides]|nr:hypothetical protein PV325_006151 [Microctonus aethiopoides]
MLIPPPPPQNHSVSLTTEDTRPVGPPCPTPGGNIARLDRLRRFDDAAAATWIMGLLGARISDAFSEGEGIS